MESKKTPATRSERHRKYLDRPARETQTVIRLSADERARFEAMAGDRPLGTWLRAVGNHYAKAMAGYLTDLEGRVTSWEARLSSATPGETPLVQQELQYARNEVRAARLTAAAGEHFIPFDYVPER